MCRCGKKKREIFYGLNIFIERFFRMHIINWNYLSLPCLYVDINILKKIFTKNMEREKAPIDVTCYQVTSIGAYFLSFYCISIRCHLYFINYSLVNRIS